jgi:tetratricopeptide (TPR) repeat protein
MGIRPPTAQPAVASATVSVTTTPPAKSGSNKGILIGVVVAVAVAGGAFMSMGDKEDANKNVPAAAPVPAPVPNTAPVALSAKDHLNQLLGLSRDGRWKDVPAKVALVKSMGQVSKTNSPESQKLTDQGLEALRADQLIKAAEILEKAIQADPGNYQARFGLGTALTRQDKFDAAITVLIDSLQIAPDVGSGWLTAAEVFSELDKTEAATSALKLAYFYASNRDNARKFLEDASRINSAKFRKVIENTLPALSGIPAKP